MCKHLTIWYCHCAGDAKAERKLPKPTESFYALLIPALKVPHLLLPLLLKHALEPSPLGIPTTLHPMTA